MVLGRRDVEPDDAESAAFHRRLWEAAPAVRRGRWALAPTSGWPDDPSHEQLLAWRWSDGGIVVVNLGDRAASGRVDVGPFEPGPVVLHDALTGEVYERDGDELSTDGLFVRLEPWHHHVLCRARAGPPP